MPERPPAVDRVEVVGASGEPRIGQVVVDPFSPDQPVAAPHPEAPVEEVEIGTGAVGIDVHEEGAFERHAPDNCTGRLGWMF